MSFRTFPFRTSSTTAFYDSGPVQMKDAWDGSGSFSSNETVSRFYSLGPEGGDVSDTIPSRAADLSVDLSFGDDSGAVTMILSGVDSITWNGGDEEAISTFVQVYAEMTDTKLDTWGPTPSFGASQANASYTSSFKIGATNLDLPVLSVPTSYSLSSLPLTDLHSFLTGIYASPVGCLCTHKNQVADGRSLSQIATTIARPGRGYEGTYNYFDPDNYISTSAILLSMDPYLQNEVRKVLERSGSMMKEDTGQLPHHFDGAQPVYSALSGMIQTGPNVFWVLSCFNYAKTSGDLEWLKNYMPTLRTATNFLYSLFSEDDVKLASVPGSLMVDVFVRANMTSDTNAMLVGFFREFADAEEVAGNSTGAADLRSLADEVAAAVHEKLWDGEDHYVTQLNPDGSTRDFVDYDSNLIAVAHSIPSVEDSLKVLDRIDGGQCRAGVTFVSEVWYGEDDTTSGNTGDSWCAMGRHAWFDSLSRKNVGDWNGFETLLLSPLQTHLTESTFMHERLACDGTQQQNRTAMYFEYPSVTAMMTMKIKYGIQPGLGDFAIEPFMNVGDDEEVTFSWEAGNLKVSFSPDSVSINAPRGTSDNHVRDTVVRLSRLSKSSAFEVVNSCVEEDDYKTVNTDEEGRVEFTTKLGLKCEVEVKKVEGAIEVQ